MVKGRKASRARHVPVLGRQACSQRRRHTRSRGLVFLFKLPVPEPFQIQRHSLDLSTDRYLVIASDGVWDCVDSSEVFEVVSAQSTAFAAAQALCQLAEKRWVKLGECNDDITAIVIFFKPTTPL